VTDDDYLFDRTGSPDPDVERLERVLRPLGRRDGSPVKAAPRGAPRRARLFLFAGLAAAAAAVVLMMAPLRPPAPPSGPRVVDATASAPIAVGDRIETRDGPREVLVGDLGRVTVAKDSRVALRHVSDETTRLYLERGAIEARVSADARPRFFQVDTDAARCVDLGCRYTLDVDEHGVATVRVVTGQVAFETETREVFVPAGATCVARRDRGPGTPRFEDTSDAVAKAFDAYDAATDAPARRDRARAALDAVTGGRDTLPAWHLLQDADAEIARAAAARLEAVAGRCDVPPGADAATVRAAWKEHLWADCW
jgi:FecR-like protein